MSQFRKLVIAIAVAAVANPEAHALLLKRGQEVDSQPNEVTVYEALGQWDLKVHALYSARCWPKELQDFAASRGVWRFGVDEGYGEGANFPGYDSAVRIFEKLEVRENIIDGSKTLFLDNVRIDEIDTKIYLNDTSTDRYIQFTNPYNASNFSIVVRPVVSNEDGSVLHDKDEDMMVGQALELHSVIAGSWSGEGDWAEGGDKYINYFGPGEICQASYEMDDGDSDPEHRQPPAAPPAGCAVQEESNSSSCSDESDDNA